MLLRRMRLTLRLPALSLVLRLFHLSVLLFALLFRLLFGSMALAVFLRAPSATRRAPLSFRSRVAVTGFIWMQFLRPL